MTITDHDVLTIRGYPLYCGNDGRNNLIMFSDSSIVGEAGRWWMWFVFNAPDYKAWVQITGQIDAENAHSITGDFELMCLDGTFCRSFFGQFEAVHETWVLHCPTPTSIPAINGCRD